MKMTKLRESSGLVENYYTPLAKKKTMLVDEQHGSEDEVLKEEMELID